ncbi:GntT/GntP/DsdX family permease, partial [Escherichia coli]|uniref:GntT/GntP/DsdX family permease n=2 Tax=Bacteria TaxID=2 RepID=UPI003F750781
IPAVVVGYLWAVKVGSKISVPEDVEDNGLDYDEIVKSFGQMPSTFKAFLPIVLPIVLIGVGSVAKLTMEEGGFNNFLQFLGAPSVALLFGVLAAFLL